MHVPRVRCMELLAPYISTLLRSISPTSPFYAVYIGLSMQLVFSNYYKYVWLGSKNYAQ
jgi:hypothetical protein